MKEFEMPDGLWNQTYSGGMTLRQWYAGLALQGFIARPDSRNLSSSYMANFAFDVADAMIAAEVAEGEKS